MAEHKCPYCGQVLQKEDDGDVLTCFACEAAEERRWRSYLSGLRTVGSRR